MISKFGKRIASITLIFVVCITMLFSGSGVSKVFAEEPTKPDIEVSNLKGALGETVAPEGSFISFDLKINHKVSKGETSVLSIGYDRLDQNDLGPYVVNFEEASITIPSGEVVGTITAYSRFVTLTFNENATKYDQLEMNIKLKGIYDITAHPKTSSDITLDLPIYMNLKNPDGSYSKISNSDGIFKRQYVPYFKRGNYAQAFSLYNNSSASFYFEIGEADVQNLKDGNIEVTIPDEFEVTATKGYCFKLENLTKPGGTQLDLFKSEVKSNSITYVKNEGNKLFFEFKKDKFKDYGIERFDIGMKYKDGFSYTDNPYREVTVDLSGIGGRSYTKPIKNGEITAGGTGTILDVSKYDLTADPIILHKGDKVADNSAICDKVTIKDKADGKTVTAEEIGADKTRTDNNIIDTNKPGDYSATVTVQYKDKSVKNITVPIKVIDNVIPVKPDENGKNPEKPAGYVTVTMDPTSKGHLAEGEASQYYVNPEKEVTIPAKDAIGNLGYKFKEWKPALKGTFKADATITAQYNKLPDVIANVPDENGNKPTKPDGYVTIKVDPGENGKLDPRDPGEYFVNPNKDVIIPLHDAIANDGYKFSKWNPNNKGRFSKDMTIKAEYMKKKNITPLTGDMEMLLSYTVLLVATAGIVIGFRKKRNTK